MEREPHRNFQYSLNWIRQGSDEIVDTLAGGGLTLVQVADVLAQAQDKAAQLVVDGKLIGSDGPGDAQASPITIGSYLALTKMSPVNCGSQLATYQRHIDAAKGVLPSLAQWTNHCYLSLRKFCDSINWRLLLPSSLREAGQTRN